MEDTSLRDAIYTQRAIRHFSDRPISDEAVQTICWGVTRGMGR